MSDLHNEEVKENVTDNDAIVNSIDDVRDYIISSEMDGKLTAFNGWYRTIQDLNDLKKKRIEEVLEKKGESK